MNMISQLRSKFTSGNSVPVTQATITAQEFDQLQAEWIKRTLDKEQAKTIATNFYYWWHNQPGTNTLDGFDEWWETIGSSLPTPPKEK